MLSLSTGYMEKLTSKTYTYEHQIHTRDSHGTASGSGCGYMVCIATTNKSIARPAPSRVRRASQRQHTERSGDYADVHQHPEGFVSRREPSDNFARCNRRLHFKRWSIW